MNTTLSTRASIMTPVPSPGSIEEARVEALGIILSAEGADLDDELSCWRALMRNRVGAGEAMLLTPRAIDAAHNRQCCAEPAP